MSRKIFIGTMILLLSVMIFSVASAKKSVGTWRLDANASADLPRSFRFMTDDWHVDFHGQEPTRQGLDNLHASASGQPSQAALKTIYEKIQALEPDAKIFMVDLRQESHGFANSLPISWHTKHNAANAGKNSSEVAAIEIAQLKNLRGIETTFEPLGKTDTQILRPLTIVPRFMSTERDAAENVGFEYVRFAVADMQFPAPEIVDEFVLFVVNLPDNAWLHFHCHAGHGRTTTFLAMYDMMKNPDVSLEEICRRQYLLGGTNLLLEPEGKDWNSRMARDRAQKIRLFYEFLQGTRAERIGLPWSEWIALKERSKKS